MGDCIKGTGIVKKETRILEDFDSIYVVLELAESDLKKVIKSAIHLQIKHI